MRWKTEELFFTFLQIQNITEKKSMYSHRCDIVCCKLNYLLYSRCVCVGARKYIICKWLTIWKWVKKSIEESVCVKKGSPENDVYFEAKHFANGKKFFIQFNIRYTAQQSVHCTAVLNERKESNMIMYHLVYLSMIFGADCCRYIL